LMDKWIVGLDKFWKKDPRRFQWNGCLRPPSPFILSPRRGDGFRWFPVLRMNVRPIQSYKFSEERRTLPPLLGERAGVRADVFLACRGSWRHRTVGFHASSSAKNIAEPKKATPDFCSAVIQESNNPLIHFSPLARGFVKKHGGGGADV
jgi:hypothetical protein